MVEAETIDYIRHRLQVAGGNADEIFDADTLPEIHRLTFGIPRLINTLCDTALTACMVDDRHRVNLEVIDNVVHELRWQWFEDRKPQQGSESSPATHDKSADGQVSLMVYRAGELLQQTTTSTFPFVIGRSNANDLVIIDKEVSRRHALIDCIGGIYVIEDLNSRNGILVNQKPRGRALLRSGDIISFGGVDVVFYLERQHELRASPGLIEKAAVDAGEDTGQRIILPNTGNQALG
jgi:pSer/pThr/pTyr-binding forkhead associated (FHA) protein